MGLFETEAIVLRTYKLAEADKIVTCLTKEHGLVRGVARGARRLKSRFGASLEPFTLVSLSYFEKEGRELVSIGQTDIIRSYFSLAVDSETVAALEYLSELALEFSPPNEPNEKMFRMVKACIEAIAKSPENLHSIVRYYELWTLKLGGFLPDLRACGLCGRRLGKASDETVYIGIEGSIGCDACMSGRGQAVTPEAHGHLRAMQSTAPVEWAEGIKGSVQEVKQELANLTKRLITNCLERPPRGQSQLPAPINL